MIIILKVCENIMTEVFKPIESNVVSSSFYAWQ